MKQYRNLLLAPAPAVEEEIGGVPGARPDSTASFMHALGETPDSVFTDPPPPKAKPVAATAVPAAPAAAPTKPAAAAPPVEPEPKPEDKTDEGEEKWPRSSDDWKKFKAGRNEERAESKSKIDALEKRVKEFETKIADAEARASKTPEKDPTTIKELEALKAENDELTKRITGLNVEKHPRFEKFYGGKVAEAITEAKMIVGEERAAAVEAILKIQDETYRNNQLNDFMADLDENAKIDLRGVVRDMRKIENDRRTAIADAKESNAKIESDRAAQNEGMVKQFQAAYSSVIKQVQDPKSGLPLFKKLAEGEGADVWNAAVDQRIKKVEALVFGQTKHEDLVRVAAEAVAYPDLLEVHRLSVKSWKEQAAKYEAQIEAMTAAQPSARGSGPAAPGAKTETKPTRETSPMDTSAAWTKNLVSAMDTVLQNAR